MTPMDIIEEQRLEMQRRLDAAKTQTERNKLGQFATPTVLATDILEYAKTLVSPSPQIRFLDPAFGTGAFYSALLRSFTLQITKAWGYEIDPHYGQEAKRFWARTPLELSIANFTQVTPPAIDEKGRVYGGGLYKIEPNELANAPANDVLALLPGLSGVVRTQLSFLDCIA